MPVQYFQDGSDQAAVTPVDGPSFSGPDQVIYDAFRAELRKGGNGDLSGLSDEGLSLLTSTQEPEQQGFMSKAKDAVAAAPGAVADWVTGANVEFPELQGKGSLPGATAAQNAAYQLLIATTLDDYKLETGIKNIFPDAKNTYDKFGNLLVTLDDRDAEGNVVESSTFYPNARGLDIPTTMQVMGGVGVAGPIKSAVGALAGKRATQGYLGAAATATTEGALLEGASKSITGLPYDWGVPLGAGIFGPAFLGLGRLFGKAGSTVMKRYRDNPASVLNPDGSFTEETITYIRSKGLEPDEIQASLYDSWRQLVDQGFIPEEAVIRASTQGLPFEVKLTKGQLQGNPGQMLWEDMISKGVGEANATRVLNQFYDAQIAAVKENMEVIAAGMGAVPRRQGGQEAQDILTRQKEVARLEGNAKYALARKEQQAFLEPESARAFADGLDAELIDFHRALTPKVWAIVDDLKEGLRNGMDVDTINVRRQQLSTASKEIGSEGQAAAKAIDAVDTYLDNVVKSTLFQQTDAAGNPLGPEAIKLWKDAISTWSGYKQRWDTRGILKDLTDETMRDGQLQPTVAPNEAVNYIFGRAITGLGERKNILRDMQVLKEQLPTEYWNQLRGEVVTKLFDGTLTNASEASQRNISGKLSSSWATARSGNKGLIDTLFSREEQGMITALANVTGRIANRTQNSSNSGAVIGRMVGVLYGTLGLPVPVAAIQPIMEKTLLPLTRSGRVMLSTRYAAPTPASVRPIIIGGASSAALDPENLDTVREVTSEVIEEIPFIGPAIAPVIAPPPQASVSSEMLRRIPDAPPTKWAPGDATSTAATPDVAPPPNAVAQNTAPQGSSAEMMQQLFPFG